MTIEPPPQAADNRFRSLDALRGICALLVALYHFDAPGLVATSTLVRNSYIFVDYFFVLSGFVIAFSYGERIERREISAGKFITLRFGRIYPLHLAMLGAYVATDLALALGAGSLLSVSSRDAFSGPRTLPALLSNIFLLQSFGIHSQLTWNGPAWSIAAEMWSYVLFGLVLLAPRRAVPWVAGALSMTALGVLLVNKTSIDATYDFGFVRCVYGFGLGFLLFRLFRRLGPKGGTAAELTSVLLAIVFVCVARDRWTFAAPPVFAIGIYVLASARGVISRLLSLPPFQFLGLVSYSIYMVHSYFEARFTQVLHVFAPSLTRWGDDGLVVSGSQTTGDVISVTMLALLVVLSYTTYRLIEKPGQKLTREFLRRRAVANAATTTGFKPIM